ncbi:MAG: ABC transporter ATP-binding protein [Lachnospiraceae bacterium]|nr:ABC transporter ATP-binding protein [Lachnospiraceae bacterium]
MQNVKTFFRMFGQLNAIINRKERRKAIIIAILSVFCALLETLGVGVILPFILAILQPETLLEYDKLKNIFDALNIQTPTQIVFFMGIGVVTIYVIKNVTILSFNRYKLYFRNGLERDLSIKMLQSYINKPYTYFLSVNSSEMMRGINGDNAAVALVVDAYCVLFNEGMTCLMLGIMLILINPIMALGITILAIIIVLAIVLSLRGTISRCAVRAREAFTDRYRYAYESINGIKEIGVMKRQKEFLKKFSDASFEAASNNTKYLWIDMMPSRLTEMVFVIGLVIIVIIAYVVSDDTSLIAAQLSALGVAAMRILPSTSNMSNAMNSLVFQRPSLESAYDNLVGENVKNINIKQEISVSENKPTFENEINIKNISWRYKEDLPNVLEELSLTIKKGEAVGLIGESGAGKTTLADIILGLFVPQSGSVTVDGKSVYESSTAWHKMIGYVPQSVFLIDDTIRNNILFGIDEKDADEERIKKALKQAQLTEFVENQADGLETILGERGVKISGGQRQRIAIARALYYDPDILVLDEATSALDNDTEAAVIEAINALQGEKTLIIVAHRLTTIEKCDKVYEIKDGKAIKVR